MLLSDSRPFVLCTENTSSQAVSVKSNGRAAHSRHFRIDARSYKKSTDVLRKTNVQQRKCTSYETAYCDLGIEELMVNEVAVLR